jgi:DNA-binding response OmpR family regulator
MNSPSNSSQTVLIVDEDEVVLKTLTLQLQDRGWDIIIARNSEETLELFQQSRIDAALIALGIPGVEGMELADTLRGHSEDLVIIILTSYPTLDEALGGLPRPGYDYLIKPFRVGQLLVGIERARSELALIRENSELRQGSAQVHAELEQVLHPPESSESEGDEVTTEDIPLRSADYGSYPGGVPGTDSGVIASYERQIGATTPEISGEEEGEEAGETSETEGEELESDE